jgi:hypothetical protein
MTTAKRITLACWLALATACAEDGGSPTATTNDRSDAQTLDRIGGVPIGGACATSYELTNQVIVNEKDLVSADYSDGGSCRLSHVGAGTLSNSGSIDFTTTPAKGTGTFTLVAANGDRLEGHRARRLRRPQRRRVIQFHRDSNDHGRHGPICRGARRRLDQWHRLRH